MDHSSAGSKVARSVDKTVEQTVDGSAALKVRYLAECLALQTVVLRAESLAAPRAGRLEFLWAVNSVDSRVVLLVLTSADKHK